MPQEPWALSVHYWLLKLSSRMTISPNYFVGTWSASPLDKVVLSGGTDVGKAPNGDEVSLTGSREAQPGEHKATGGGTFVHKTASGALVASGVYFVTGFNSFAKPGGTLAGLGLTDGIDTLKHTSGGELR